MTKSIKWAAQLQQVREVSLFGLADLDFWQQRLAVEELTPTNRDGRAMISIVSAAGVFAGIRFREVSVSVGVESAADAEGSPTYFLVRAFNSIRFFAFCERVFFATPYDYAAVKVELPEPTEINVTQHGRTLFQASMLPTPSSTRRPADEREESFLAQVMLPSIDRIWGRQKKMFFARISGITQVYPFRVGEDSISLDGQNEGSVFHSLVTSHFEPVEWSIRSNARHAKSKTYNRG